MRVCVVEEIRPCPAWTFQTVSLPRPTGNDTPLSTKKKFQNFDDETINFKKKKGERNHSIGVGINTNDFLSTQLQTTLNRVFLFSHVSNCGQRNSGSKKKMTTIIFFFFVHTLHLIHKVT